MNKMTGNLLAQILDDCGIEFRYDYSGRGMFGDVCPAVEGSFNDFLQVIVRIAEEFPEDVETIASAANFDSMGLDMVMYWPRFTYKTED